MFVKNTLEDFPQSAPNTTMQDAILRLNLREGDEAAKHLQICADVSWYETSNFIILLILRIKDNLCMSVELCSYILDLIHIASNLFFCSFFNCRYMFVEKSIAYIKSNFRKIHRRL